MVALESTIVANARLKPASSAEMIERPSAHFHVRGVRFADPRIVLTRKQHQRRDKDLRDVGLLAGFFDRENA